MEMSNTLSVKLTGILRGLVVEIFVDRCCCQILDSQKIMSKRTARKWTNTNRVFGSTWLLFSAYLRSEVYSKLIHRHQIGISNFSNQQKAFYAALRIPLLSLQQPGSCKLLQTKHQTLKSIWPEGGTLNVFCKSTSAHFSLHIQPLHL